VQDVGASEDERPPGRVFETISSAVASTEGRRGTVSHLRIEPGGGSPWFRSGFQTPDYEDDYWARTSLLDLRRREEILAHEAKGRYNIASRSARPVRSSKTPRRGPCGFPEDLRECLRQEIAAKPASTSAPCFDRFARGRRAFLSRVPRRRLAAAL